MGGWAKRVLELEQIFYHPAAAAQPLLRGLNLRLRLGEPALVAGRSGSGKSTLLEIMAGLASPTQGQILWQGKPTTVQERRWLTGLVFQFPERHFLGLSVGQELRPGKNVSTPRLGRRLSERPWGVTGDSSDAGGRNAQCERHKKQIDGREGLSTKRSLHTLLKGTKEGL